MACLRLNDVPRPLRRTPAGFVYHVCNRGSRKGRIFETSADYDAFEALMEAARAKYPVRIVGHCLMRTHFHLLLWPSEDEVIPRFMQWLEGEHGRRWHWMRGTQGRGAVFQSRYRCVPIKDALQYFTALRYVERNALAAQYVELADAWPWCSASQGDNFHPPFEVDSGPFERPPNWLYVLNEH
jgi:putative transposase